MRSATSNLRYSGPARTQPMLSAKPGNHDNAMTPSFGSETSPAAGRFGVGMFRDSAQSCDRMAMARGFSASGT